MNIPDKKTRDLWRITTTWSFEMSTDIVIQLLDAVDALEDKVAGLEDTLKMEQWESMQRSKRDDL